MNPTTTPPAPGASVILDAEGGPFFITLSGPAATVSAAKADFDSWLKNFK